MPFRVIQKYRQAAVNADSSITGASGLKITIRLTFVLNDAAVCDAPGF